MTNEQYKKMCAMIYGNRPRVRTLNGCLGWEWSDLWKGVKSTGSTALDIYGGYASQKATKEAYKTALETMSANKSTIYTIAGLAIGGVILYKVLSK